MVSDQQSSGNVVKEENVKFMPIYTGVEGEETQGLCIGTENYMCVNSNASEADQKASLDFLKWVFSSDEGKEMVTMIFSLSHRSAHLAMMRFLLTR